MDSYDCKELAELEKTKSALSKSENISKVSSSSAVFEYLVLFVGNVRVGQTFFLHFTILFWDCSPAL